MPDQTGGTADAAVETAFALCRFGDASPELIEARTLQERVDRKYLLPARVLDALLARLSGQYRVVLSAGRPLARYHTQYFDTPARELYHDHRRGRRPRYKVRLRHHLDRRLSFLEIKRKGADERTRKSRLERPFGASDLDGESRAFIGQHCLVKAASLVAALSMRFCRITLVGEDVNERVTIDCRIELDADGRCERWPEAVIAEIKQARYDNLSPSVRALRDLHVRERAVSKYCLATARLAAVPDHTFRPTLRALEHLSA